MKDYPVTRKILNKIHWGSPTKLYFKRTSSTCYRDKATIANGNYVIPGYRLRVFGVGVCDQRTNAAPRCQHVSSSHCPEPKISQSQPGTDGYLSHIPPMVFVASPPSRYSLWNKDCTTPCLLVEQLKKLEKILQSNGISWATELKTALPWPVSIILSSPPKKPTKKTQRDREVHFSHWLKLQQNRNIQGTDQPREIQLSNSPISSKNPKRYQNQTHPPASSLLLVYLCWQDSLYTHVEQTLFWFLKCNVTFAFRTSKMFL